MSIDIWASTSSTDWAVGANWSLLSIPADTNVVVLTNSSTSIDTNLDWGGSALVSLDRFDADKSYTGGVGTSTSYLVIGATTFNLGLPAATNSIGSGRMNIDAANSGAVINVFGSATSATDPGMTPVRLLGTTLVVSCTGGSTGIAASLATETASVASLTLAQISGGSVPTCILGGGCTLTTANVYAGIIINKSTAGATTVNVLGSGSLIHQGSGGYTTLTLGKSTSCNYSGTGTIGTLNVTGNLDLSGGTGAVTVTNCNVYPGGTINDPEGRLTFSNPLQLVQCTLADVKLVLGYNKHIQVS